jgi:predicted HicB family RNase H-like nuclease
MLLSLTIEGIKSDLVNLGQLGGEDLVTTATRLGDALEPALRGRLIEAFNVLVADANQAAGRSAFELRLSGDDVALTRTDSATGAAPESVGNDLNARIALRLPEELKGLIEERAQKFGSSVNSWIVRSLAQDVDFDTQGPRSDGPGPQGGAVSGRSFRGVARG